MNVIVSPIVSLLSTQASELSSQRVEMTADELRAAAERERIRLEEAGEIDRVGDNLGVGADAAPVNLRIRYITHRYHT